MFGKRLIPVWVGILALGEPGYRPKIVGVLTMFAGLVLVALG